MAAGPGAIGRAIRLAVVVGVSAVVGAQVIRMAVVVPVTAAVGGPVIRIVVVMAGRALEVPV